MEVSCSCSWREKESLWKTLLGKCIFAVIRVVTDVLFRFVVLVSFQIIKKAFWKTSLGVCLVHMYALNSFSIHFTSFIHPSIHYLIITAVIVDITCVIYLVSFRLLLDQVIFHRYS